MTSSCKQTNERTKSSIEWKLVCPSLILHLTNRFNFFTDHDRKYPCRVLSKINFELIETGVMDERVFGRFELNETLKSRIYLVHKSLWKTSRRSDNSTRFTHESSWNFVGSKNVNTGKHRKNRGKGKSPPSLGLRNVKQSSQAWIVCQMFFRKLYSLKRSHLTGIGIPIIHVRRSDGRLRFHDDVIRLKHFPRYWPFVRGILRYSANSLTKASDSFLWSAPE